MECNSKIILPLQHDYSLCHITWETELTFLLCCITAPHNSIVYSTMDNFRFYHVMSVFIVRDCLGIWHGLVQRYVLTATVQCLDAQPVSVIISTELPRPPSTNHTLLFICNNLKCCRRITHCCGVHSHTLLAALLVVVFIWSGI
jgi:hypothetical protein